MDDEMSQATRVQLLRAKAHELETQVLNEANAHGALRPVTALAADVALVASMLADEIERRGERA